MTIDRKNWPGWLVLAALFAVLCFGIIPPLLGARAQRAEAPRDPPPSADLPKSAGARLPLSAPDDTFKLPPSLAEISGLSVSADGKNLWAVHDERGQVFRLSIADGSLLDDIPIGDPGDYESVEDVDGTLYVGRSDGVLVRVDPKSRETKEIDVSSALGKGCDLEGLGYQREQRRLLLACKGTSLIHALEISTGQMMPEPAYSVPAGEIAAWLAAHQDVAELRGKKDDAFSPSGLAVHPKTGELYLVSTTGEMLVVLDRKGKIVRIHALDRSVHAQPEGIAIAEDGTLYISNEARGKTAVIHVFRPNPRPSL